MTENKNLERRQFVRVQKKMIVGIQAISDDQNSSNRGYTKNVSKGGVLFEYNTCYPLSTVLGLEIRIPYRAKPIECYGKVMRVEEVEEGSVFDIGISFMDISSEDSKELEQFIQTQINSHD